MYNHSMSIILKLIIEEGYISAGGSLKDPELFDADYFNISKFDAALMDPQYRLALQHSVNAIRDAALSLEQETVGVFIGKYVDGSPVTF